jgi:hypothetical protein
MGQHNSLQACVNKAKREPTKPPFKNYYGQNVRTIGVLDVEWTTIEHVDNIEHMSDTIKEVECLQTQVSTAYCNNTKGERGNKMTLLPEKLQRMAKSCLFKL